MNKKQGTVSKAISYAVLLLAVIAVCGFLAFFTDGFTGSFKTFYVELEGKQVLSKSGGYEITTNKPMSVEVKYTFGAVNNEISGYSVKIVPNIISGKDFDFITDGAFYSYQSEKDLTAGFDIHYSETSFTVLPKGGITEILSAVYPGKTITDCRDKAYKDMFALVITSYNGEASVTVCFSVVEKISGVILDREVIIF